MSLIQRIVLVAIFLAVFFVIIAFARGYRIDFEKKTLTSTGILAVSSSPRAAKIYLDGVLKGVTDMNLTLPPGNYSLEIKKDGYTSWSKKITLKGELVLTISPTLFPLNPSLSPLTNLGVSQSIPVDQTDNIIVVSQTGDVEKDGIYLFEAVQKPLSFLPPLKLIILKKNLPANLDLTTALDVVFSPDYKQGVFKFQRLKQTVAILLSLEEENKTPFDVTGSADTLIAAWDGKRQNDNLKILGSFPADFAKIASDSFHIISFSPNETKLLYQVQKSISLPPVITPPLIGSNQTEEVRSLKKDHFYVYDKKEDKNYEISNLKTQNSKLIWFPDSQHLIFNAGKKLAVVDYDGTNEQTVYSGPFENSFFTTTSDGSLIVLTNLNPEANKWPDLYAVGIR